MIDATTSTPIETAPADVKGVRGSGAGPAPLCLVVRVERARCRELLDLAERPVDPSDVPAYVVELEAGLVVAEALVASAESPRQARTGTRAFTAIAGRLAHLRGWSDTPPKPRRRRRRGPLP